MKDKRLGRGISALIPEYPDDTELVYRIAEIEVGKISGNPHQPRQKFDVEGMSELMQSIKTKGIIQPVTVRKAGDGFEIIAGERRLRASQMLGLKTIPAYVIPVETDEDMLEMALVENLQREDLNPIEEAEAYRMLSNTFELSHEEIADRVGKNRSTVTNSLRLLNLPESIQNELREGVLSSGHARTILAVDSTDIQKKLWKRIKKDGLSVRAVEELVKKSDNEKGSTKEQKTKTVSATIKNAEDHIMHVLGTKVRIKGDENKGSVEIEFYSKEDLSRLLELFDILEENL